MLLERNRTLGKKRKTNQCLSANIRRQGKAWGLESRAWPGFFIGRLEDSTAYCTRSQTRDMVNPATRELLNPTTSMSRRPSSERL